MSKNLTQRSLSSMRIRMKPLVRGALLAMAIPFALGLTAAHGAERSGESIVNEVCANCHRDGKNGAPVIGDQNAWATRKAQGLTNATQHALEGIRNMPSHGGNAGLSSADLERAITYMVNQSGGNWIEPPSAAAPGAQRTGEQLVKAKCGECHLTGQDGAPKIGDQNAWVGRVSKGLNTVIASGIHGRGAMPARGGMADISDSEMRAAVLYMFTESIGSKTK
ncbi:MAG: cytochrome c5 family protein [Rhodoferax sp.]|uniref:c-type cytochrome n=1 Tax=Rhodoferax sp. TaxID=50421 RepID=UPI001400E91D|nr:c-type cytochrome [Rhodoferax sp.]NDP40255.1 cytochrome c5 family protein [Rhodoferax sp.]